MVTNSGDLAGSHTFELEVDDSVEDSRDVSLDAGGSQQISFSVTRDEPGTYAITVAGLDLSFTVKAASGGLSIWLVIILVLLLLAAIGIIVWLLIRYRQPQGDSLYDSSYFDTGYAETEPATTEAEIEPVEETQTEPETEADTEETAAPETPQAPGAEVIQFKGGRSLTITAAAIDKLKESLLAKTDDPEIGFRLTPSPQKSNQLKMALEPSREGDRVIEREGRKVVILSPEVMTALEGMVMDYRDTGEGGGFSITESNPEA